MKLHTLCWTILASLVVLSPNVGSAVITMAHVEVVNFQAPYAFVPLQITSPFMGGTVLRARVSHTEPRSTSHHS